MKRIITPLNAEQRGKLNAGDIVSLTGTVYAARDQAHLKLKRLLDEGRDLPLSLEGCIIYYCGPTPGGKREIGSCGPTTSSRMDPFTPSLLTVGIAGMIGKGRRSTGVRESMKEHRAIYFVAPAGAGAYLSTRVVRSEIVAFPELGPEAVYRLDIKEFPLIVCTDAKGRDLFEKFDE